MKTEDQLLLFKLFFLKTGKHPYQFLINVFALDYLHFRAMAQKCQAKDSALNRAIKEIEERAENLTCSATCKKCKSRTATLMLMDWNWLRESVEVCEECAKSEKARNEYLGIYPIKFSSLAFFKKDFKRFRKAVKLLMKVFGFLSIRKEFDKSVLATSRKDIASEKMALAMADLLDFSKPLAKTGTIAQPKETKLQKAQVKQPDSNMAIKRHDGQYAIAFARAS